MLAWEVVRQGDPDRGSTFSAGAFPDTNLIQGVNKNDWRLNLSTIQSGIENRLWSMADELRANSQLRASEYSTPVLGLIFLRYADHKFTQAEQEIGETGSTSKQHRPDIRISSTWCLLPSRESTFSTPAGLTGGRGHCTGYQRCDASD
jgi:hypothetical protein